MVIARPVDWKQALYFSSPLVSQFVLVLCFVQNAPFTLLGSKGACSAGYFWIELAIYRYLAWKPTLQLQNIILEFDFSRKREKSVANTRAWDRLWNCETHNKVVRLGTSICIKYITFMNRSDNLWIHIFPWWGPAIHRWNIVIHNKAAIGRQSYNKDPFIQNTM